MRVFFFLLCSFIVVNSFALNLSTEWTMESRKMIHVSCEEDETVCQNFCQGHMACMTEEKVCKNCVGTSIAMTYAFQEMGRSIVAGDQLDPYFLFDFLSQKNYVTLTSRSVYNLVDSFDSMSLRRKFRSLCQDGTRYPMVFFNKTEGGEFGRAQAIWCDSGVFQAEYLSSPQRTEVEVF